MGEHCTCYASVYLFHVGRKYIGRNIHICVRVTMTLHSRQTTTLLHFDKTTGEFDTITLAYNLVDESGNRYVDESGNPYVVYDFVGSQVLHARKTDTTLHFGET